MEKEMIPILFVLTTVLPAAVWLIADRLAHKRSNRRRHIHIRGHSCEALTLPRRPRPVLRPANGEETNEESGVHGGVDHPGGAIADGYRSLGA